MRLRQLFEATEKRAAFAVGRMNPATIGHELLVNEIKATPGDSFLFLTDRAPKLPDNPLTSQEKLDWARKSFDGIAIALAKTVFIAADRLYKMGYTHVTFLEGEDKLYKLLVKYNGVEAAMHNYNFTKIDYVRLERDEEAVDAKGMSGTKLRGHVTSNDLESFKQGVTQNAQPYAEEMFKKLQGILGVDSVEESLEENKVKSTLPDKIEVRKPMNVPKAPDATIPRSRDGYTTDAGVTYTQDKYNDNLMTVSNAGGDYTFDDQRLVKWQTSMIDGLKYTYDYVQNKITVDFQTFVKNKDGGETAVDTSAVYDMKGNKIADSDSIGIGGGSFSIKGDKSGVEIKNAMFDPFNNTTMIIKNNNKKLQKYGPEKVKKMIDKGLALMNQSRLGRPVPGTDFEKNTRMLMAVADISFRDASGKSIPARQAIAGAQEWWASLNNFNKDRNARINAKRAPQKDQKQ